MLATTSKLVQLTARFCELETLQLTRGNNDIRTQEQYKIILEIISIAQLVRYTTFIDIKDLNDTMD